MQWLFARLFLGVFSPRRKILGMELAGVVEAIGANVTRFKVGDAVMASTFDANFGAHTEYKCLKQDGLIELKPDNISFEEAAAAVGGGMTAMRCLKKATIQPGQEVLIYGASGAVGTNAVQIAKNYLGAEVTAVCSTRNLELATSIGADYVIDYTKQDFTQNGKTYDVIFDAVAKFPESQAKTALKPGGTYLNAHHDSNGSLRKEELTFIVELLASCKLKPVIDRCYPLEEIVDAYRFVDTGRKRGNVVITVKEKTHA